ncbi:putative Ig domain-containing protein [Actinoplanes sp. NPDC051475]|uniref:putative Ig domain-containing protein n=1 Tax=Actinoplanes sp. NPDC051475 TaxID=3157225 RepID=UPI00344F0F78
MSTDRAVTTPPPPGDEGLSLLEVMMSIFVIGTVMAAVAPFLVTSMALSNRQRSDQAAVQVANGGIERVRALKAQSLAVGRDMATATAQWTTAPKQVADLLDHTLMVTDPKAGPDDGPKAPLPTDAVEVTINNTVYEQEWYVGNCWQAKVAPTPAPTGTPTATPCDKTDTGVPFFRVVVSVKWKHAACPNDCIYVASTLVSRATDPTFEANPAPPKVGKVLTQYSYVDDPAVLDPEVELQIKSSGGHLPLTWTATGLPPGLVMDPDSGMISGSPTAAGTYSKVTVAVTDKDGLSDDTQFDWIVFDDLVVAPQSARSTRNNTVVNVPIPATGGRPALTWTATGLPAGLTINASTGVITGRTAMSGSATSNTTITVTDAGTPTPRVKSVAFDWYVGPVVTPLSLMGFSPAPVAKDTAINYDLSPLASGGLKPYTWSATGLPNGLTISSATGRVTGTMLYASQYITTVTVADSSGQTKSIDITVEVTAGGNDMRVTSPSGSAVSTPVNQALTATTVPTDSLGSNPPSHTWTAVGLPPGVVISSGGAITGKPTTRGTYRVTLMVTNNKSDRAYLVFDWTVT